MTWSAYLMHAGTGATARGASLGDHLRAFGALLIGGRKRVPARVRERRWAPRTAVFRIATLHAAGGMERSVALKNLSATGARVEFYAREPLPERLLLIEPIRGLRRHARVVWQDDFTAGLEFTDG